MTFQANMLPGTGLGSRLKGPCVVPAAFLNRYDKDFVPDVIYGSVHRVANCFFQSFRVS